MNYTKLLIYFILGFIVNIFFKRKNIEGFNFDIISASSYPDLIDIEDMTEAFAGEIIMTARAPWFE